MLLWVESQRLFFLQGNLRNLQEKYTKIYYLNKNRCKKFFFTIETNSLSTFSFLSIIFKSNGCLYLCLVHGYRKNVVDLDEFDFNGVSDFSFNTDDYANRVFTLILV